MNSQTRADRKHISFSGVSHRTWKKNSFLSQKANPEQTVFSLTPSPPIPPPFLHSAFSKVSKQLLHSASVIVALFLIFG